MPSVMELVGGVFERRLNPESGTCTSGIDALQKRLQRDSYPLPPCKDTESASSSNQKEGPQDSVTMLAP